MLRLREVQPIYEPNLETGETDESFMVIFEGVVGGCAEVRVKLHMDPRPTDAAMLADGQKLVMETAAALHHALAPPDVPQSKPATS